MSRMIPAVALTVLTVFNPGSVFARVVLEKTEAAQNSFYKGVIQIDHGCKGAATTAIHVTIPEGFIAARPMPKPGWTLSVDRGAYAKPYQFRENTLVEGAKTLTWKGSLPADDFDEFVFQGFLTDAIPAGSVLYFPVLQECATGAYHWTDVPSQDDVTAILAHPAPGLRVMSGASLASAVSIVDHLRISDAWARAPADGQAATQAYLTVENRGPLPDRLVSATSDAAGSIAILDARAADEDGQNSAVPGGLSIAPGERLQLRPGAYHFSLSDLKKPLHEGDLFQITAKFEKSGSVTLSFPVEDSRALSSGAIMPIEDAPDRM